jgi:muramoyltetrapeptide carboxypeptidase
MIARQDMRTMINQTISDVIQSQEPLAGQISMNRRKVLQTTIAAALIAGTGLLPAANAVAARSGKIQKPRRLAQGDTIGLVAPASSTLEDEGIRISIDLIRSLGFKVKEGAHIFDRQQYLAGEDRARADDVNRMFADDEVDAIFCLRGGYGTPRILPYLDYDLIRNNPKIVLGMSDITGILTGIHTKTGLVGYHGPNASGSFSDYSLSEFKKVLTHPTPTTLIGAAPPFESGEGRVDEKNRLTYITGGTAKGRLIGGNLTLISVLMGTEFEPDFRDRIVFLEDVHEAPYRIDRMLTQLRLAGKFQEAAGIAFGKFTDTDTDGNTFSLEEVLRDRTADLGIPVVRGFMIGHVRDQTVVPIGIEAELNGDAGTLRLLEPAVT